MRHLFLCPTFLRLWAAGCGRSNSSVSDRYVSPLEQSRPGTSSYRKRSASPARGSFAKRGRQGRGMTPPSVKGKGFQKLESCPCPAVVGSCLSLHWQVWSDKGADPCVVEVLRWGYRIPFHRVPALSEEPIPYPAYSPSSIRGKALEEEVLSLLEKGAIELAPLPSPGYYSRLFVVMKASGSWRPVIDLSLLNLKIQKTSFKMETLQSVLLSVRAGDWMVSLDLKAAYLQVPMHPESRKFLRFIAFGKVYQFQFKVLCFGLSTAPQVFTQAMAPVSAFLHRSSIRLRQYVDNWLVQASSR